MKRSDSWLKNNTVGKIYHFVYDFEHCAETVLAPPSVLGAWSMALGLWLPFEYYYYYYYYCAETKTVAVCCSCMILLKPIVGLATDKMIHIHGLVVYYLQVHIKMTRNACGM